MMRQSARNNSILCDVGPHATKFLNFCGYQSSDILNWSGSTRLLHDLGMYGDDISDDFQVMHEYFSVDFSDFDFNNFFPVESCFDAYIIDAKFMLQRFGMSWLVNLTLKKYEPIDFNYIEQVLINKKWNFVKTDNNR